MDVTLVERVDALVQAQQRQLLSTTPKTVVIERLASRIEALEQVVHEMALEIERLSNESMLPSEPGSRVRRTV